MKKHLSRRVIQAGLLKDAQSARFTRTRSELNWIATHDFICPFRNSFFLALADLYEVESINQSTTVCTRCAPLTATSVFTHFTLAALPAGKLLKFVATRGFYTCASEVATDSGILTTMHLRIAHKMSQEPAFPAIYFVAPEFISLEALYIRENVCVSLSLLNPSLIFFHRSVYCLSKWFGKFLLARLLTIIEKIKLIPNQINLVSDIST